ncbi:hypothetical protein BG003_003686 [Podila horticola]|nr:hypothetical protein BG003_003686 [Podila horticola]
MFVLSDLYTFDTKTYIWTKVTDTPVGYYDAASAISGDSLVLDEQYPIFNDLTPSIYNLKENTWVTTYTPSLDTIHG